MRSHWLTAAAAALLLSSAAASAQTQSSTNPTTPSNTTNSSASATAPSTSTGSMQAMDRAKAMSQDKVRQTLSQAGFQDVKIVDAAYFIQAKTKDGDTVMMILNPPSIDATGSTSSTNASAGNKPAAVSPNTGSSSGGTTSTSK